LNENKRNSEDILNDCNNAITLSSRDRVQRKVLAMLGRGILFTITSVAALAVLAIIYFIAKDALPFFQNEGFKEFFTVKAWYPTHEPAQFGAAAIFTGTLLITVAAVTIAVPPGIFAAFCMSDILPFNVRQVMKPVIEMLAAIPSVAYGFFALVVLAPLMQNHGGTALSIAWWVLALPVLLILSVVAADLLSPEKLTKASYYLCRTLLSIVFISLTLFFVYFVSNILRALEISSGVNALNASIISSASFSSIGLPFFCLAKSLIHRIAIELPLSLLTSIGT